MENKILKTKLVVWKNLSLFQPENIKKFTKVQRQKLKKSLKKNGLISPFHVWQENDKTLWCLDGHQRIPAMLELESEGEKIPDKLPANYIDLKNKKEAKKAILIYNSKYADMIQDPLNDWIGDLNMKDISEEIGIKDISFGLQVSDTMNDDELPENVKSITKKGDIWCLGDHKVMCGDSVKEDQVKKLMGSRIANMVFTDPPYNVRYGESKNPRHKVREISNDKQSTQDWIAFNDALSKILKKNCSGDLYVWGGSGYDGMKARCIFIENGLHWSATIIWKKDRLVLSPAKYQRIYEPCLYGWFNKSSFVGDRKNTEVWEMQRPMNSKLHPTMKPIELCERGILLSSMENNIVLDLFLGSGSTLIACEKTDRKCYGMELDPHYCDVIVKRYAEWCNANKRKPKIKLNGKNYALKSL